MNVELEAQQLLADAKAKNDTTKSVQIHYCTRSGWHIVVFDNNSEVLAMTAGHTFLTLTLTQARALALHKIVPQGDIEVIIGVKAT